VNREVCEHFAPLGQFCARCNIDPKSLAGILLREHDSLEQAQSYAERKARQFGAMGSGLAMDYAEAAKALQS